MSKETTNKTLLTEEGYERLSQKVEEIQGKVQQNREDMSRTAKNGDLSENAGFMAAKESYEGHLSSMNELRDVLNEAKVIGKDDIENDRVGFGNSVTVKDLEKDTRYTYRIVGKYEARMEHGEISLESPVAQGLMEKEQGDIAEIDTPAGKTRYEVIEISK
ncbi:GreA/GreB family elongation factor [Candidatus Bipolaricaulota bacterium]|nr:GreA/GreB family elongation factor [Candidatus Bipolaricaulota bacterium]